MAAKITLEQFEELNRNLIVDDNGRTNKKCPLCNNEIVIEIDGNSHTMRCKTHNCLSLDFRGI